MQVFHGSNVRVETIDLAKSGDFKDFGKGFYVTKIRKHAHQRAMQIAKENGGKAVITEFKYYELYPERAGLSLKQFNISREWVEFVIMNRDREIAQPIHNYDIIEGPIANDKITMQIQKYIQGKISIDTLIEKLTYSESTHQICFCTVDSLYALEAIENKDFLFAVEDITDSIISFFIGNYEMPESVAIKTFFSTNLYEQLATENTLLWQKPWQEIYEMFKAELTTK
jgi:hypothetical protein